VNIYIKNPCQENWATFDKNGDIRFCKKCQFSIVDFTNKSDKEIASYLSKNQGKICGLIKREQIRSTCSSTTNEYLSLRRITAFTVGLITLTTISKAVPTNNEFKPLTEYTIGNENHTLTLLRKKDTLKPDEFRLFGRVIYKSDTSELAGVKVLVKGTKIEATTDLNGVFKILYNGKIGDKIILQISFIGFKTIEKEIIITHDNLNLGEVELTEDIIFLGEIRIPWWKRLGWRIKSLFS